MSAISQSRPEYEPTAEVVVWIESLLDDDITTEQHVALGRLLMEDAAARRYFLEEMQLHAALKWDGLESLGDSTEDAATEQHSPHGLPFLSTTLHGTFGYFSEGMPLAYLLATVIVGVGLLISSRIYVSGPEQLTQQSAPLPSPLSPLPSSLPFVGRITGMVDCLWADPQTEAFSGSHVPLGRKYALRSGLMQITYTTGAQVLLQGPCTYEVESADGGYLSAGKLTARIDKKKERRTKNEELSASRSSFLIPHSYFSVRTPTATVNDLGTEFGVEVDETGNTVSRVFVGAVRLTAIGKNGRDDSLTVHAGQTAQCHTDEGPVVATTPNDVDRFVRSIQTKHARPTTTISERFQEVALTEGIEQNPPDRYVLEGGGAVYREPGANEGSLSRGYFRTVATDFCDRDFTFEATFDVRLDPSNPTPGTHYVFFGIGDGVPNADFYDEATNGLVLAYMVDDGQLWVRLCHPDSTTKKDAGKIIAKFAPPGSLSPGRHRFRMWKSGKWVRFAVNSHFDGQRRDDYVSGSFDLSNNAPLLNTANSRLFVGTGYCDVMTVRIENISLSYGDRQHPPTEGGNKQ